MQRAEREMTFNAKTLSGNSAKDSRKNREGKKKTLMLCCKVDYRGQFKGEKVRPGANRQRSPSRSSGSNSSIYWGLFVFLNFVSFLPETLLILSRGRNISSVRHERRKKKVK